MNSNSITTLNQFKKFIDGDGSIYNLEVKNGKLYECNPNLIYKIALFVRDIFRFGLSRIFSFFKPGSSLISVVNKLEDIQSSQKITRTFSWIENINGMRSLVEAFNKKCTKNSLSDFSANSSKRENVLQRRDSESSIPNGSKKENVLQRRNSESSILEASDGGCRRLYELSNKLKKRAEKEKNKREEERTKKHLADFSRI